LDREVAIALGPGRRLVTLHRLHIDVVGQEIVAAVGLLDTGLDEVFPQEALPDRPTLHVDSDAQDRVDLARGDSILQFIECKFTSHDFRYSATTGILGTGSPYAASSLILRGGR